MDQSSNSTNSTEQFGNSTSDFPGETKEESYLIGITILIFLSLFVICIVALCIRAISKAKKLKKKQAKALLKRDSMSQLFVHGKSSRDTPGHNNLGYIDPNAYPYIPPQPYSYPNAYSLNH
jgi:preprotein translocase subunit SecG